jgi:hypothetical protein
LTALIKQRSIMAEPEKKKICAFTFQKESHTCKLFACSRCRETWYVSRDAQTKHWKNGHKFSCVAIEKDDTRVKTPLSSTQECLDIIYWCLDNPLERIKGRLFLWACRCLKWWREHRRNDMNDQAFKGQALMQLQMKLMMLNKMYGQRAVDIIWAIPGFLDFFLSEEIFLTKAVKEMKKNGTPPPKPNPLGIPGLGMDFGWCSFVMTLYEGTCYDNQGLSMDMIYRVSTPLTSAVVRQAMTLWTCRYTSACYAGRNRNDGFVKYFFLDTYQAKASGKDIPLLESDELVPGLNVMRLFEVLQWEQNVFTYSSSEDIHKMFQLLLAVDGKNQKKGPWKLPPGDRIRLLEIVHDIKFPELSPGQGLRDPTVVDGGFWDIFSAILFLVMGHQTTNTFLKMHVHTIEHIVKNNDRSCMRAINLLNGTYKHLMDEEFKSVALYVQIMEFFMKMRGEEKHTIPDEILEHITEFALPSRVNRWFYAAVDPAKLDTAYANIPHY